MKIDVVGAGPAGLYFSILAKKAFPNADVTVVERNQSDDTFGFGIVLSDETLERLADSDAASHLAISQNFAYWDDIYTHFAGCEMRSSGHGFSGIRRLTLLAILQARAAELGVTLRYGCDDPGMRGHHAADLVVAADGINSAYRAAFADVFQPVEDLRSNRFVWLGAHLTLPGFTYSFREDEFGIWNLHAYQYAPGECTLVVETTDETFRRSGLRAEDEAATAAMVQRLFKEELRGASVLTNRSFWRRFPTISCRRWSAGRLVLIGDAAHTAHFSIGSGTKLALEDAIALSEAIATCPDAIESALASYEKARRDEVGRIQHSANVSLVWFENVRRFWKMEPVQFNYSLLSRSKQITHENLRLRDAPFVGEIERWWNLNVARQFEILIPEDFDAPPMFAPMKLREMWLDNRVVVSPMAQYSAKDGVPNDWHLVHYGSRALGGAGLVFVEMTCTSADARITPGCTGLWNQQQANAWKRVVDFVHDRSSAKICMQLGHAGRKGSTQLGWETLDAPLLQDNWPLIAASAIAYDRKANQVPREMTRADMDRVRDDFVSCAVRAANCGFDMLELHMAHGYLLASFISPVTNRRADQYGGPLVNRLRFPMEVWDAVRAVWPAHRPMSVRLSATDWIDGGLAPGESVQIATHFKTHGCDLIDVSTGQTDPASRPVYGRMYQAGFSEQIRLEAGIATMAVGAVTTADQINTLLVSGRADLVALGRPHLADPYLTLRAAAQSGFEGVSWPKQYLSGAQQAYALSARARDDAKRG